MMFQVKRVQRSYGDKVETGKVTKRLGYDDSKQAAASSPWVCKQATAGEGRDLHQGKRE